jgi:hypothetical protein
VIPAAGFIRENQSKMRPDEKSTQPRPVGFLPRIMQLAATGLTSDRKKQHARF